MTEVHVKKSVNQESVLILQDMAEKTEITPVIDKIYTLEQIIEEHRYVDIPDLI